MSDSCPGSKMEPSTHSQYPNSDADPDRVSCKSEKVLDRPSLIVQICFWAIGLLMSQVTYVPPLDWIMLPVSFAVMFAPMINYAIKKHRTKR